MVLFLLEWFCFSILLLPHSYKIFFLYPHRHFSPICEHTPRQFAVRTYPGCIVHEVNSHGSNDDHESENDESDDSAIAIEASPSARFFRRRSCSRGRRRRRGRRRLTRRRSIGCRGASGRGGSAGKRRQVVKNRCCVANKRCRVVKR